MHTDELRAELAELANEVAPFEGDLGAVRRRVARRRALSGSIAAVVAVALVVAVVVGTRSGPSHVHVAGVSQGGRRSRGFPRVDAAVVLPAGATSADVASIQAVLDKTDAVESYAPLPARSLALALYNQLDTSSKRLRARVCADLSTPIFAIELSRPVPHAISTPRLRDRHDCDGSADRYARRRLRDLHAGEGNRIAGGGGPRPDRDATPTSSRTPSSIIKRPTRSSRSSSTTSPSHRRTRRRRVSRSRSGSSSATVRSASDVSARYRASPGRRQQRRLDAGPRADLGGTPARRRSSASRTALHARNAGSTESGQASGTSAGAGASTPFAVISATAPSISSGEVGGGDAVDVGAAGGQVPQHDEHAEQRRGRGEQHPAVHARHERTVDLRHELRLERGGHVLVGRDGERGRQVLARLTEQLRAHRDVRAGDRGRDPRPVHRSHHAADHRDAERAADLAGRVVHRRADAGLRPRQRAHDRLGGGRHREAHAEREQQQPRQHVADVADVAWPAACS